MKEEYKTKMQAINESGESKVLHKRAEATVTKLGVGIKDIFDSFPFYIMLIDSDHYILHANKAIQSDLGLSPDQIIGKYCPKVVHELDEPYPGCPLEEALKRGGVVEREFFDQNSGRWIKSAIYPVRHRAQEKQSIFIHMVRDITEHKRAQEAIKASLKEKERLLQEIHHRVKNNMQVISSLISLQSSKIKDKHTFEMFRETKDRVKSMALIHDKFYKSKDFAKIDLSDSIKGIAAHLFHSYSTDPKDIELKINIDGAFLDINTAIPCGLIINELVTNSLKHAFREAKGEIRISLHSIERGKFTLVVGDNGVGLPKDMDFRNSDSLGFRMVNMLVEQLNGKVELQRRNGTVFKISFKASE